MTSPELSLRFAAGLRLFLAARHRTAGELRVTHDGTSSLGHMVESFGVPLPEVGRLLADGRPVTASYRPHGGEVVQVDEVRRPQELPYQPPRFVLDVHLGALARRLRLVGLDTGYRNDLDDDGLIEWANTERRVLLTQDRSLLMRRLLWFGAYVRGARPDDQLTDVLDRFAPTLTPWTRCMACNGVLSPADKAEVEHLLEAGTRRTYNAFTRCPACGRVYWRGAHGGRLEALVAGATHAVAQATSARR
ncbi:Mut7-C ubiquitin/RNAse domain-containing protein [Streptomyces gobiensis]|uniref:Mut7-C ubiquitin/RNAse domain-containing protein n=1 Tax=Streptomyces gobiensis TaxID=2875706 RepID=UPI001E329455|nr:Mut7-C ubiquitin/RNAse domain-containing protein [Streptomyces gobiensis]UGY94579.1 Mut7-C ubiquitin/RNAse domain-containing protein [Streptomyces gobiensis]